MQLVPQTVTKNVARSILKSKKNSPHIFFAAGVAGVVGGAILACRATLKLEPALDAIKNDFQAVTDMSGYDQLGKEKYSETQYRKDVGYVYMKGSVKLGALYAPAIVIGGLGIAALTGSHIQLTKRNAALTATLASVMKAYEAYRDRVKEEIGEKKELELYRDVHNETVEEDGKKITKSVINPNKYSVYARVFDAFNPNWQQSSEYNRVFLQVQENYANDRLNARGHVLLNDVYDALGLERSQAGCVVGWVKDGDGDGFIDFGIFEGLNSDFINQLEPSIWLDFNVDGVVFDKIEKGKNNEAQPF